MDTNYTTFSIGYIAASGVVSVIGTFGNTFTLSVLLCFAENRVPRNAFLVSLSLADWIVSAIVFPAGIAGAILGEQWFQSRFLLCAILCTICAPGCMASMLSMCWIAISRYYYICDFSTYIKAFSWGRVRVYLFITWLLCFFVLLPNHVGWGETKFNKGFRMCTIDMETHSYSVYYGAWIMTAICITFYFYWKIYQTIRRSSSTKTLIMGNQGHQGNDKDNRIKDEMLLLKTSFKQFISYIIAWTPIFGLCLVGMSPNVPIPVYMAAVLVAHSNSMVNFFIYFVDNKKFRKQFKYAFRKVVLQQSNVTSVGPQTQMVSTRGAPSNFNSQARRSTQRVSLVSTTTLAKAFPPTD